MKKSALIAVIAVPIVLAYPAAAWVLGKQVDTALAEQYKHIESIPYIKVIDRQYERGVFASSEVVTFEVLGDMFRSIEKMQKEAAAADPEQAEPAPAHPPLQPLRFTVRSQIKHGPAPGMSAFAAAIADSELVLDGPAQQELAKLIGDKKPLTAHTVYRFDGGGNAVVASPAFAATFPGEEPNTVNRFSWEGFSANVDFTKNLQSYTMTGEAPKLEMLDGKGVAMVMTGLKFSGEQTRIFDDEPLLYSGSQRFTLAQMSIADKSGKAGPPVLLKQVAYDIALPVNGEFIDMVAKMGAESVQIGEQNYGPAHYDFSLKHLHARTTAKLYRAMMKMYSDPVALADPTKAFAPLAEPGLELLKHNPEFRIDRLSFKTPQGEAAGSASAKLKDAKPEDLANPMMLLAKLEASADIALPESLLANMSGGGMHAAGEGEAPDPETVAAHKEMLEQQLAGFAEQGYITRAGGLVKSKIEFRDGQLTVNGKPFNPMAMRGGEAEPAEPSLDEPASAPLLKN
ncbi:MAG: YdgA family protein [Sterolibacteriaceae bacterium]|uniref:YdgA family protein n=1 Tax=Candidatus Methylophosphatis roskildensis TaxID=2899263 RepID=A0A9D7HL65_9PROT|nr:YdgA family protein [Candidatus Methylophosphatis roskildensis]